jgi:hypothetical protein
MRTHIIVAALALLPLVLTGHARADEPKMLTLSCEGRLTRTYGGNTPEAPQPLQKTGVVVDLDQQTVFFLGYTASIYDVDEASINFGGTQLVEYGFRIALRGNIDRLTGRMDATTALSDPQSGSTLTVSQSIMMRFAKRLEVYPHKWMYRLSATETLRQFNTHGGYPPSRALAIIRLPAGGTS